MRKFSLVWLIITLIIYVFSLLPWFNILLYSPMAFDAGVKTSAIVFISLILAYPFILILCEVLAWIFYAKKKSKTAVIIGGIPLLAIIAIILVPVLLS